MAKQGVWGERNWIYYPILNKRVSCATCTHYCHEDRSCMATSVIPHVVGFDHWKNCSTFELSPEYFDSKHMNQVKRYKGDSFFGNLNDKKENSKGHEDNNNKDNTRRDRIPDQETPEYSPVNVHDHPVQFSDRVIRSMWTNHNIELIKCKSKDNDKLIYQIKGQEVIFIIEPVKRLKMITAHRWSIFKNKVKDDIKALQSFDPDNKYIKGLIIPQINNSQKESYAEDYLKKEGSTLNGIRLFEMDESDVITLIN